MKSKKELVSKIAKRIEGNPVDIAYAKEYAVKNNRFNYILDVYQFFVFHPEHAAFCLRRLCGYDFQNL